MHIEIGGRTLSVAQLGPDFLILETSVEHPPADAILFFSIDGNERRRSIRLPNGISPETKRTLIAKAV